MKDKIYLVEYLNLVNENNVPVGHAPKVLKENNMIFQYDKDVIFVCGKSCASMVGNIKKTIQLDDIYYRGSPISMTIKRFKNISNVYKLAAKESIIWFTNVDWTLFVYLALTRKKHRTIATLYRNVVDDYKNYKSFARRAIGSVAINGMKYINLYVVTNPELHLFENEINLPDYFYYDYYDKYRKQEKKDRIVCLGSMRGTKDLNSVINHFNQSDIEVVIGGDFLDKKEYESARKLAKDNVKIFDHALSFEEYYELLGSSRYSILPYRQAWYENSTSGILLESAFLDVISIAPNWLLKNNHINGLGYDNITDLPLSMSELKKKTKDIHNDISKYKIENIRNKLNEGIGVFCK